MGGMRDEGKVGGVRVDFMFFEVEQVFCIMGDDNRFSFKSLLDRFLILILYFCYGCKYLDLIIFFRYGLFFYKGVIEGDVFQF